MIMTLMRRIMTSARWTRQTLPVIGLTTAMMRRVRVVDVARRGYCTFSGVDVSFIISIFCHFNLCCLFCHPNYILRTAPIYIRFHYHISSSCLPASLSAKIPPGVITRKLPSYHSWPNRHPLRSSNHHRLGPWCHRLTRIGSFFARSGCAKSMAWPRQH